VNDDVGSMDQGYTQAELDKAQRRYGLVFKLVAVKTMSWSCLALGRRASAFSETGFVSANGKPAMGQIQM
jgi:hypothetical protein